MAFVLGGLLVGLVACTSPHPEPPSRAQEEKTVVTDASTPKSAVPTSPHVLTIKAQSGAPTTLVVLLHGVGADAESFHGIAKALAPSLPSADFVTPDGFEPFDGGGSGRQWFSISGVTPANRAARVRSAAMGASAWIDEELKKRGLPRDRVVVVGFSQGSIVGAWLAMHRTPSPAAVVMFSGRVADDEVPVAHSVSTPILMLHGTADPRIPVGELDTGASTLEAWGAHVTKRVYPGLGHTIDERELRDAAAFLTTTLGSDAKR